MFELELELQLWLIRNRLSVVVIFVVIRVTVPKIIMNLYRLENRIAL